MAGARLLENFPEACLEPRADERDFWRPREGDGEIPTPERVGGVKQDRWALLFELTCAPKRPRGRDGRRGERGVDHEGPGVGSLQFDFAADVGVVAVYEQFGVEVAVSAVVVIERREEWVWPLRTPEVEPTQDFAFFRSQ